jgi:hypothetical protein
LSHLVKEHVVFETPAGQRRFFTVTRDADGTLHWTITRTRHTLSRAPRPLLRGW